MNALDVPHHLVANHYAKQILEFSSESEQEFYPSREEASSSSGSRSVPKKVTKKQPSKPQTKKRPFRRNGLSFNETKNLDQLYLKGPASYGSKLPLGKVQYLILIYTNIIEYQYVGDVKAPLLRVIGSNQRPKNGSVCELEPTHRIVFTNLDCKKLLTNTFQSISIELRTETGQLVPFSGTGKSHFNLTIQKI